MNRPPAFSGRLASQDAQELAQFIGLLQSRGVRRYGEIGAREGDTFHAVMLALPKGSVGVALDLPGGAWGKPTTRVKLEKAVADLCKRGYKASALFGDSTTGATFNLFRGRGPYDAILIDGDHRLPGVTSDWQRYGPLAPLVAFHDIAGDGQQSRDGLPVEVPLLWRCIRHERPTCLEFVTAGSGMGIGVLIA
jgi:hypothetical protein